MPHFMDERCGHYENIKLTMKRSKFHYSQTASRTVEIKWQLADGLNDHEAIWEEALHAPSLIDLGQEACIAAALQRCMCIAS